MTDEIKLYREMKTIARYISFDSLMYGIIYNKYKTLFEFEKETGIRRHYIHKWSTMRTLPGLTSRNKLSIALGIDLFDMTVLRAFFGREFPFKRR